MIAETYTLFSRIPLYVDEAQNKVYAGDLWEKDLSQHLKYIADFRICCPVLPVHMRPESAVEVADLNPAQIRAVALDKGWGSVFRNLLPNFLATARAVKGTEIVHSGGAGWAFPLSYYILLLRPFMRFKWIMVIESSFWRKPEKTKPSVRQILSHYFNGFLVRRCVRAADANLFTQDWYRALFLDADAVAHVDPAVWVDADDMVDEAAFKASLPKRTTGPARLIFPARLVAEKGVETVLEAIEIFSQNHKDALEPLVQIDLMGEGPLAQTCRDFAAQGRPGVTVRFVEQVPYGAPFFTLLRDYEALIIANRQAEQPRIIFDGFAQGLPCLASRTPGIMALVEEDHTAWGFDTDDSAALARLFERAAKEPQALQDMAINARYAVNAWTHAQMHQRREAFLKEHLNLTET